MSAKHQAGTVDYCSMSSAADVLDLVGRIDREATSEVSRWLIDVEQFAEGGPETLADLGALADRLSPSVLVNAHLMWRGAAVDMLEESDLDRRSPSRCASSWRSAAMPGWSRSRASSTSRATGSRVWRTARCCSSGWTTRSSPPAATASR